MKNHQAYAHQALGLMDLTSLNDNDTDQTIIDLCQNAITDHGHVAAVCVFPKYVAIAKKTLLELGLDSVKVATVTNFPNGTDNIDQVIALTEQAIADGADEIDVVLPYKQFVNGELQHCEEVLVQSKQACADHNVLKVIIESGELGDLNTIKAASEFAIDCGADFIKTSTGKVTVNATLEAADVMLNVIKENGSKVGFKAAGGIRTTQDAQNYLIQAEQIMGVEWITASNYRFGASGLLNSLKDTLSGNESNNSDNSSGY